MINTGLTKQELKLLREFVPDGFEELVTGDDIDNPNLKQAFEELEKAYHFERWIK